MTTKQKIGAAVLFVLFFVFVGLAGRADIEAREMITGQKAVINR